MAPKPELKALTPNTTPMLTQEHYNQLLEKLASIEAKLSITQVDHDRIGDISLAMEVTNYRKATIYKKIKETPCMPHRQDGTKLFFSEKELREWMITRRDPQPVQFPEPNRKNKRRPSLLDRAMMQ